MAAYIFTFVLIPPFTNFDKYVLGAFEPLGSDALILSVLVTLVVFPSYF